METSLPTFDDFLGRGHLFAGLSSQLVMEEPEQETDPNFEAFFADAPYLLEEEGEGAPPPFALPPPPRPPWLDLEESCAESSPIETCDNIIIIDSQVHLEETFQNLIIIAVCSALLVIMLVFSVACIWRLRSSRTSGCRCADAKTESEGPGGLELADNLQLKNASEVYDNPNYSHIMIGGQPFFILPSGELSEHVPVPSNGELLTPRQTEAAHIYEGGSTSYRSTSDYDTDSSTYRPDSDRVSNGFPPIYEEIDSSSVRRRPGEVAESQFHHGGGRDGQHGGGGRDPQRSVVSPVNTMAVMQRVRGDAGVEGAVVALQGQHPPRPPGGGPPTLHWQPGHKSLSPRRPNSSRLHASNNSHTRPPASSSVYYYSDTLRRRGLGPEDGRESVQESDSGVSSRSGHNTSSESTPQPLGGDLGSGRSFRRRGGPPQQVVSSSEDFQICDQQSPGRGLVGKGGGVVVDTQVVVRNTNTKREPIVKL